MQDQQEALSIVTEASTPTITTTSNSPSSETASTPSSQQNDSEQNNTQQRSENSNSYECPGEATSYEQLGIITARPKRPEYVVYQTRLCSFNKWPETHHMKSKDLANAGYYYSGYSDCIKCFCCDGGLRNWKPEDDMWVEHARWFPKCVYLLQEVGSDFINTVQAMSKERDEINYDDVIRRMQDTNAPSVMRSATGEHLTSEKLYEAAKTKNLEVTKNNSSQNDSQSNLSGKNEEHDKENIEKEGNTRCELRQPPPCKICQMC